VATIVLGRCTVRPGADRACGPAGEASFTEEWYLLPHDYPIDASPVDIEALTAQVAPPPRARTPNLTTG
jgi:hypothetical protein